MSVQELGIESHIASAITPTAGAAGSININGSEIDMEGYENLLIVVHTGAIVAGAAFSIKAQQDIVTGMASAADLLGTSQTILDTEDDQVRYIDIIKPIEQFIRLVALIATQNVTLCAFYIKYNGKKRPSVHGSNVSGETHISPIEGTA